METLQINPIRHLEVVKGNVRMEFSVEEIRNLAKAAGITESAPSVPQRQKVHKVARSTPPNPKQLNKTAKKKTWGISQEKKDRILAHVRKNLTSSPQSLSKLLNGATYAPNDLPTLREYIEQQSDIARMTAGKLTYYFKASAQQSPAQASPPPASEPAKESEVAATAPA